MEQVQQAAQQVQQQPSPEDVLAATNQALIKKKKQEQDKLMQDYQNQSFPVAQISQAAATLKPNNKDTMTQIGKAIATPDYAYSGLCLKWVDDQQGNANRQPTAYADYQTHAQEGDIIASSKDIPKGSRVYFAPDASNGDAGHVGIANGDGTFTSATDNGIKTFSLKDWQNYTGQQFIGYAPPQKAS